jgi:hypothetical protein
MKQQRDIAKSLSLLPAVDEDAQISLVTLCTEFICELDRFVDGNGGQPEYLLQMRPTFLDLKQRIEKTKPKLSGSAIPDGELGNYVQHSLANTCPTRLLGQKSERPDREEKDQTFCRRRS